MKTVKLSYTILDAWASFDFERAIGYYLGQEIPPTEAMELGRLKHEIYAEHTLEHKTLHEDFGGGKLDNPIVEQKHEKIIPLSDDIQILLRGRIDLEHDEFGGTLEDYKVGLTPASQHTGKHQLGYYKLLRPHAKVGRYRCFNPYTGQVTVGIKYLTDKVAEDAMEHIITYGSEIIDYLQVNKLLKDYYAEKVTA